MTDLLTADTGERLTANMRAVLHAVETTRHLARRVDPPPPPPNFTNRPPTAPPVNAALLRKTLDHIEAHPEEWEQSMWVSECGTQFCFAGTALRLLGYDAVWDEEWEEFNNTMTAPGDPDDERDVMTEAIQVLGITPQEAGWMFQHNRTLHDLRQAVTALTA